MAASRIIAHSPLHHHCHSPPSETVYLVKFKPLPNRCPNLVVRASVRDDPNEEAVHLQTTPDDSPNGVVPLPRNVSPFLLISVSQTETETLISDSSSSLSNHSEILRAIDVVERDSLAIAQSFTSLFASLRLALSHSTSTSLDHMRCFTDASGRLQESVLDAATKGNSYINSCLRKILRRHVDALDSAVNKLFHVS